MTPRLTARLRLWALVSLTLLLAACATPQADLTPSVRNELPKPWAAPAATASEEPPKAAIAATPTVQASDLLEDALQPGQKVDLAAPESQADLWSRVRQGFAMPDLDDAWVQKAEGYYSARPDYVERMMSRGQRYLFHIVEEVQRRGLPTELALLPFIESAFVTTAQSRVKATGMWQFMPATGRDFALKQNIFRDDRRDVLESTRAALDYLERLYKQFGDWHLALAAYNWGQGNVAKALARNEKLKRPTDYASLKMPDETRYYVPKLQAIKNIVLDAERFGLALPSVANHPYFLSVKLERDIDVELAAQFAGLSVEEFSLFNPQSNKPVILAAASPRVLLPYDQAGIFARNLAEHQGQLASWTAWVVPKTMSTADAAKRFGLTEARLRELNQIPPKMLVRAGSTLLVPRDAKDADDVAEAIAESARLNLTPDQPPLRKLALKAGKADTVASVAARYKVSPQQVASWNKVGVKARFKPGQTVVVYAAPPAKAGKPEQLAQAAPKPARR